MALVSPSYIEMLTNKLKSESQPKIRKALINLAKATKNRQNVYFFRLQGGLNRLLQLVRRQNKTIADMALSVLANCSMEEESRREVRRLNGIVSLVDVLRTIEKTSILNRTARALANLAEDELNADVMEELGTIPELVKMLTTTSDSDCQQSVLRALRIICSNPRRKQVLLDFDGFKTVVELLKSDKAGLVHCCAKALAEFTKSCSKEIAQQVQEYGGIKEIVTLAKSDSAQVRNSALLTLANLAYHSHVRVCIGSEGGIEILTDQVQRGDPVHVTNKAIEGICFCCREAINRKRVHECGALELLLKILNSGKPFAIEKKVVAALTCFYYCEPSLEVLLNGGLVPALVDHLDKIIAHTSSQEDIDDDVSDQLCFSADFTSEIPRSAMIKGSRFELKNTDGQEITQQELFQKLEDTAKEVSDTPTRGRIANFKRRMNPKLKPSPIPTSPLPGVHSIGSGQSIFSVAGRCADTTSLVSVCTSSCTMSTLAASESNNSLTISVYSSLSSECQIAGTKVGDASETFDCEVSAMGLKNSTSETQMGHCATSPENSKNVDDFGIMQGTCDTNKSRLLLSPLSPKPKSEAQHHGHNVLLLLSRISQMTDPTSLLVNKACIQTLLNYITSVHNPNPKSVRLLNRLAANPSCFKALIVKGAVVAFHHQLWCRYQVTDGQAGSPHVSATHGNGNEENKLTYNFSGEVRTQDVVYDDEQNITPSNSDSHKGCDSFHQTFCHEAGRQLLDTLTSQAQTPFGKGVLESLLLRGSHEECQQCVLALPLLCRSKKLKLNLLVDKKGFRLFCDMLTAMSPSEETFMMAVESLMVLADDLQIKPPDSTSFNSLQESRVKVSETSSREEVTHKQIYSVVGSQAPIARTSVRDARTNLGDGVSELHSTKRFKMDGSILESELKHILCENVSGSLCMYSASTLEAFDVTFLMDSGEYVPAHRRRIAAASEVFAAMLSTNYLEGTQAVIAIPEIALDVFETALHHVYGCSTSCSYVAFSVKLSAGPQEQRTKSNFFLELFNFADRFLMDELKAISESCLIHLVDHVTVVQFCNVGIQFNSSRLSTHCLYYLLQRKFADLPKVFHLFRELFLSDEKKAIVEHLYKLLLSHIKG